MRNPPLHAALFFMLKTHIFKSFLLFVISLFFAIISSLTTLSGVEVLMGLGSTALFVGSIVFFIYWLVANKPESPKRGSYSAY